MGSILSRVDSRQGTKDDHKSSAGVRAKRETIRIIAKNAPTQVSLREREIEAPPLSSSKKSAAEKATRRISDIITLPNPHSTITQAPSAPLKEKRKAQVLIKNQPPGSTSSSTNRIGSGCNNTCKLSVDQGNSKKNPLTAAMADGGAFSPSANNATRTLSNYSPTSDEKENNALQTATNMAASSQSRKINETTQDHVKELPKYPSTAAKTLDSTHFNASSNAATIMGEQQQQQLTTKVPVDPPGTVLGALPFVQYLNGQQHIVSSNAEYVPATSVGGMNHPIFHPLFPSMTNWGYHHNSYHNQGHLTQEHHGIMTSDNRNTSQQWVMPYFLAPFASTVCPPNSTHKPDELVIRNSWPSDTPANPSNNAAVVPNSSLENFVRNGGSSSADADETMSTDESVATNEEGASENKKVEEQFIPTTFAPPECIERIRAKQKAAAANQIEVQPRQTRSMSRRQRRDCSRSKSSKSKPRSTDSASSVAHQACSPRINLSQVDGTGAKVAVANGTFNEKNSPSSQVMTILGKRVIMIDPVRKVFIIDLLSPEVCDEIRMMADNHTREIHKSGLKTETWRTLYTYTKMDLPVAEVKDLTKKYTEQILLDVKKIVGEIFGGSMRREAMNLRPRSWKEPHLLLYQKLDDRPHHTGIEMHYDGCDITWQAMLTRIDEYEGGGTYFRALRKTVKLQQGQVLVHPGELYHMGCDITYGVRCLLVCFTDGMNPKILDDSKSHEDHPSYRNNVVLY